MCLRFGCRDNCSCNTITQEYGEPRYLALIRQYIADLWEEESPFHDEIEVDGSHFCAKRVKGKRGRGAGRTLQAIIRGTGEPDSAMHSDGWRGYNDLVDVGYKKPYRAKHGNDEFTGGKGHINGTESFWSFAERRLMKFHGVPSINRFPAPQGM